MPIRHFLDPRVTALDDHIRRYHNKSPIRIYENGINQKPTFYPGVEFGKQGKLQAHFQRNIEIHTMQTDPEILESVFRCHEFYNPGLLAYQRREYAVATKYEAGKFFFVQSQYLKNLKLKFYDIS